MDSINLEVIGQLTHWLQSGQSGWLCTITATFGSSPRPVGSILACNHAGEVRGSLSGGCVEDDLIAALRSGEIASERPEELSYGVSKAETERLGLPCGGRLSLVVEPLSPTAATQSHFAAIFTAIEQRRLIGRTLDLSSGQMQLFQPQHYSPTRLAQQRLTQVFGPRYRLLLVGTGQIARYLAEMALALDFEVILTDPRPELLAAWNGPPITLAGGMPDDAVRHWADGANSAVVTLTHDPRIDDMALMEALNSSAFYVGALGSLRTSAQRRERLEQLDLPKSTIARLDAPIGLPIQSKTPPEIAISILAKLIQVRARVDG